MTEFKINLQNSNTTIGFTVSFSFIWIFLKRDALCIILLMRLVLASGENLESERENNDLNDEKVSTRQHLHNALKTRLNPMQINHTALLHATAHPSTAIMLVSNCKGIIADASTAQPKQIMYKLPVEMNCVRKVRPDSKHRSIV